MLPENFTPSCNLRLLHLQNIALQGPTSLLKHSLHYGIRQVIPNVNWRTRAFQYGPAFHSRQRRNFPLANTFTPAEGCRTFCAQTLPPTYAAHVPECQARIEFCRGRKGRHILSTAVYATVCTRTHTCARVYTHTHTSSDEIRTPAHTTSSTAA